MATSKAVEELKDFVRDLQALADEVLRKHKGNPTCIQSQPYAQLHTSMRLLIARLGARGLPKEVLDAGMPPVDKEYADSVDKMRGLLSSIGDALEHGRLSTIEELVTGDVLTDFLEQAEALLAAKFNLPAAVLLRAIIEERLRKLCAKYGCPPIVAKPTIEHFKQALYAASVIDKITQKKIDWMAGVGNAAAHALPEYRDADVPILYKDTVDFLARFAP
jgi:hypothetical protein